MEEEIHLGMNIMKISSKVMLSYHLYSYAIELEYSCCVIIVIYELAYSLCVMNLTCSTSCLIIHMVCMSRSTARVGVMAHHSFGFAHILHLSIRRVGDPWGMGSFFVHGRGARVHRNLRI